MKRRIIAAVDDLFFAAKIRTAADLVKAIRERKGIAQENEVMARR